MNFKPLPLIALSLIAFASTATAGGGTDNPKEKTCIERTYDKERNRGTDHKESRERSKEVCRDAGRQGQ